MIKLSKSGKPFMTATYILYRGVKHGHTKHNTNYHVLLIVIPKRIMATRGLIT